MIACTSSALDAAALARGTLAQQMPGAVDVGARDRARARLGQLAERLPPSDRVLLAILARGDGDGGTLTHTGLARRLGTSRQAATRRRRRLLRRVRRVASLPPAPELPPTDELADHLADCAGLTGTAARRTAAVAEGATAAAVARQEGVTRTAVSQSVSGARSSLDRSCPTCARVADALDARAARHRTAGGGARRAGA